MIKSSNLAVGAVVVLVSSSATTTAYMRNAKENAGNGVAWTATERCSCFEYLTNDFFHSDKYNFIQNFNNGHHPATDIDGKPHSQGYFHMAEFCCEFAAELVDPKCELIKNKNEEKWVNGEGEPEHAGVEAMICDLFATPDVTLLSELKQQARNACYCFYRDLGCGRDELGAGGYCDYPHSEVMLDDFRMANNSAHNMCNACLEQDKNFVYKFPENYEGQPHEKCLGYCLLKRGDPNDVYKPTVSNERCCLADKGTGLHVHGYDENHIEQEVIFMPFGKFEDWTHDYFFKNIASPPLFAPPRDYQVSIAYDGLGTAFMSVERYGTNGASDYPLALFNTTEFPIQCEPEYWDSLSVHVFDQSADGGIVFKDVTMDGVELGDFGFAIQPDPDCSDTAILPDIQGIHEANYTCISRPGGFGHMSGFEFKGMVQLSGQFQDDDIGLELIIGCSKKEEEPHHCCCEAHGQPHIASVTNVTAKW